MLVLEHNKESRGAFRTNTVKHRWSFFAKSSILEVRLVSQYFFGDLRISTCESEQRKNRFLLPYLIYFSLVLHCIYKPVICFDLLNAKQSK